MARARVYICGNDATICEAVDTVADSRGWETAAGNAFTDAACEMIERTPDDARTPDGETQFVIWDRSGDDYGDWHGGQFDQPGYRRCGLCAVRADAPRWLVELAEAASDAGLAAAAQLCPERMPEETP